MSTVILPTASCFDDAVNFVAWRVRENRRLLHNDGLVVVHGICLFPEDHSQPGKPFAHAWVEEANLVWRAGMLDGERVYYPTPLHSFLTQLRVQKSTRYTLLEAARRERAAGTYGPWEPEYQALCKDFSVIPRRVGT